MRFWILAGVLFVAGSATAEPIFPDLVAGEYAVRVMPAPVATDANNVPLEAPTRSIAVARTSGEPIACVNDPPQGVWTPVAYSLPASSQRQDLVAVAYGEPDCAGAPSPPSTNTAYHFVGVAPNAPAMSDGSP